MSGRRNKHETGEKTKNEEKTKKIDEEERADGILIGASESEKSVLERSMSAAART